MNRSTVPVGKVPQVKKQFNAAANPTRAPQVPKPALKLNPPRQPAGPSLGPGPATSAVPLKTPLALKKTVAPKQAFNRAAAAPLRATPAFNKAAAPTRGSGPTRTRTR
jgi:hypothetical protein